MTVYKVDDARPAKDYVPLGCALDENDPRVRHGRRSRMLEEMGGRE